MNVYDQAVTSTKEAFKTALDTDVDASTLSELWRHYLGLRAIADKIDPTDKPQFNIDLQQSPLNYGDDRISL